VNKAQWWGNDSSAGVAFLATDKPGLGIQRFCQGRACRAASHRPLQVTCVASGDSLLSAARERTVQY
jgi:hypothetical protein